MRHGARDGADNRINQTNQKTAGAIRLFGALSGVEEGYLAACEEDSGVGGAAVLSGMTRFIHRYGRAAAAVLCIAVLGVSYLSFRVGVFPQSLDYAGSGFMPEKNMSVADSAASEREPEAPQEEISAEEVSAAGAATEDAPESENRYAANSAGDTVPDESKKQMSNDALNLKTESADLKNDSGAPEDRRREMKLAEAQTLPVVGAYLPEAWPADGRIGSVKGSDASGEESVSVTWTYGNQWDSFFVTVSNLGTAMPAGLQEAVADISKPETYDRRLYEIPYADSVPAEYIAVFLDPVFREEDFTRECVEARILSQKGDSGDTDTPRGNFRVLYRTETGEYVLANFNGRGSAEDVWRVMRSINYFAQYEPWQKPPAP